MNKTLVIGSIVGVVVIVGGGAYIMRSNSVSITGTMPAAVSDAQPAANSPAVASSSVPLMQSTGALFSQYKNFSEAYEIFPTLGANTKKALGAFSYTEENLGNGEYRITITNNAEGYQGESVVVGTGQSAYFIEPSLRDDSAAEDSATTDDSLVAVDAQGYMLK